MEKLEYAVAPGWWHGLAPLNFGWEACAPCHQFGPAVRHYHLLHYVLEGEGTFLKGGATYRVDAGDLFVIRPEEVTTYRASAARPWQYVWLGFQAGETPPFLQVPVIRQPPVRKLFESLREQCRYEHQDGRVFALLYDVLWRLSQDAPPPASRQEPYAAYAKPTWRPLTCSRSASNSWPIPSTSTAGTSPSCSGRPTGSRPRPT